MRRNVSVFLCLCALGLVLPAAARAEVAQEVLEPGQASLDASGDRVQGASPGPAASADGGFLPEPTPSPTPRADCGVIRTVVGDGTAGGGGDQGLAVAAELNGPMGACFDAAGDLFIADRGNQVVREVDRSGLIKTVAGNGTAGFGGDGGQAVFARLDDPSGVAVDAQGDLYIADTVNNRIRRVDGSGAISTVAGDGLRGRNGDGGPALSADLDSPEGLCLDPSGNLYIAEPANHEVRKLDLSGTITTVAGNGAQGSSGQGGPAAAAALDTPIAVCADSQGGLFIADAGLNSVLKVDPSGDLGVYAGGGMAGYQGDGGAAARASLDQPYGVAVDPAGDLYIADKGNHVVRKVSAEGVISTVAGNGQAGSDGDLGPAGYAELAAPEGLALDPSGDLAIVDLADNVVRKVACP